MQVSALTPAQKESIVEEWKTAGISPDDTLTLERLFSGCHDWCAVKDAKKTLAVFEIRSVVGVLIKNMEIRFAPYFLLGMNGQNYKDSKKEINELVEIFGLIFAKLIAEAKKTTNGIIKIHNPQEGIRTVFYEFAAYLETNYPTVIRNVKLYKNWIEIEVAN